MLCKRQGSCEDLGSGANVRGHVNTWEGEGRQRLQEAAPQVQVTRVCRYSALVHHSCHLRLHLADEPFGCACDSGERPCPPGRFVPA